MKLCLVYYENAELQDPLLQESYTQITKSDIKPLDPTQILDDVEIFRAEIYMYFVSSFLVPTFQTCQQFEKIYDASEFQKYMNYFSVMQLS